MTSKILIVYDTNGGQTYAMARKVALGVDSVTGCEAVVRSVAPVSDNLETVAKPVPDSGAPYASIGELAQCSGLILGSPTHFGNMSAAMKYFIDQTSPQWLSGELAGKPAAVFTSTGSMHGGQETTLLTMLVPLMHHGMLITGLPYSHPGLMQTTGGGTPYGASHVSGESGDREISATENELCILLGQRVAEFAKKLAA